MFGFPMNNADFARFVADIVLDPGARVVPYKKGIVKVISSKRLTSKRA